MDYDDKVHEVEKYSDINIVLKKVQKLENILKQEIDIDVSYKPNKKFMIRGDFTDNKWIHFGSMDYEDYTKHKDKIRRLQFQRRNHKWKNMPMDSPAWLSYWILW